MSYDILNVGVGVDTTNRQVIAVYNQGDEKVLMAESYISESIFRVCDSLLQQIAIETQEVPSAVDLNVPGLIPLSRAKHSKYYRSSLQGDRARNWNLACVRKDRANKRRLRNFRTVLKA